MRTLHSQAAVFECVQMRAVDASASLSISCHVSSVAALVAVQCLVSSNRSCFLGQAVVELLSLCGLCVVSGLLVQDRPKWHFFFILRFLFQSYTHTGKKHLNTSPHVDMHASTSHMGCEDIWSCGEPISIVKYIRYYSSGGVCVALSLTETCQHCNPSCFVFAFLRPSQCCFVPQLGGRNTTLNGKSQCWVTFHQTFMVSRLWIRITLIIPQLFLSLSLHPRSWYFCVWVKYHNYCTDCIKIWDT